MASIQRRTRGDGTVAHRVMFRIGDRQTSESFSTPEQAEWFKGLVERIGGAEAIKVRDAQDGSTTLTTTADWVRTHIAALSGITEGTRQDYLKYATLLDTTALGQLPVDMVTRTTVAGWVNDQAAAGLSGKTIRNRHGLLSAAFARAVEEGLRPDNPCRSTRIPVTQRKVEMCFLTHSEFATLLAAVPTPWQPFVLTQAGTGLRWGEITALRVRDVDLDATPATLTVSRAWKHTDGHGMAIGAPKTSRGRRTIPLPAEVVAEIRPLLAGKAPDDLIFTAPRGGTILHRTFHHRVWVKALEKAQLGKKPRIHDLRHSYASWLLSAGVPVNVVQRYLGHESITTTVDTYGHIMPDAMTAAARALSLGLTQAAPEAIAIEA